MNNCEDDGGGEGGVWRETQHDNSLRCVPERHILLHCQMQKKCHEAIKGEEKRWKESQAKENERRKRRMKKNITSEKT